MINRKPYWVLIVDDHTMFRQALVSLLTTRPDLVTIRGQAEDGCAAVTLAKQLAPDIILLDLGLPDCNGIQLIPTLKASSPRSAIVVLSASADPEQIYQAACGGVDGYLTKNLDANSLFEMLTTVAAGQVAITQQIATLLVRQVAEHAQQNQQAEQQRLAALFDDIDRLIIQYVAAGATNTEIADQMSISPHTVKVRLTGILEKLELDNRTQLAVLYSTHTPPRVS